MKHTPAFFTLAALYQKMANSARAYNVNSTDLNGHRYSRNTTGTTSFRLQEPIIVSQTDLVDLCTRNEWYIVGLVMKEMYEYNALWLADALKKRTNNGYRLGIIGLVKKEVLYYTETANMYLVNPAYLRRGDPFAVAATTANMLMNAKPVPEMLTDKKPAKSFDFSKAIVHNSITNGFAT
jgi:hypothetical protein